MTQITSHENEGVRASRGPRQTSEMTDCVTRRVKQVEGAVSKVVECSETASLYDRVGAFKVDLYEVSPSSGSLASVHQVCCAFLLEVTLTDWCIFLAGISRKESVLETRTNNQIGAARILRRVSQMVPMPMTTDRFSVSHAIRSRSSKDVPPYNSIDLTSLNAILLQYINDLLLDRDIPATSLETIRDGRRERKPILRHAQVEKQLLARWVLDQERP